ncbi:MAG: STAS domain-containing protein [Verrucomicrobiota bacterium]|nr:STAS domain-containing protein [Limisphaera sp.]MDW8381441.1 STAS domain-containing protein [Verrucomicrobiota bacterium]
MSLPKAKVLVMVTDRDVWLRVSGHAKFTAAPDFKSLVQGLLQKGYRRFHVDLSECILMDSTFLGLLCRLGVQMLQSGDSEACVRVLNPSPRVVELIEGMGVRDYLQVVQDAKLAPGRLQGTETVLGAAPTDREVLARTSLEAHETLMSLSPENLARFKDVARFLAEDLQRLANARNPSSGSNG